MCKFYGLCILICITLLVRSTCFLWRNKCIMHNINFNEVTYVTQCHMWVFVKYQNPLNSNSPKHFHLQLYFVLGVMDDLSYHWQLIDVHYLGRQAPTYLNVNMLHSLLTACNPLVVGEKLDLILACYVKLGYYQLVTRY